MLKAVDKRAQDRIGNHADITQFKETVLLSNEELITELPVVAFEGLITAPSDMKVGNGTLMLSKLTRFDGSSVHRLHFYIDDKDSTFKATQRFKTADLPNAKAEAEAEQFVMANHGLTGTFASAFVENNLVHIHSEVEETSRLAQRLIGSVAKSPGCCKTTCIPCCNMCCYIACCKWCPNCCDFCPDCCACCKLHPYYIHWDMDVQSQSATERLAQLLSEPWELEKEGMAVKM